MHVWFHDQLAKFLLNGIYSRNIVKKQTAEILQEFWAEFHSQKQLASIIHSVKSACKDPSFANSLVIFAT